MANINQIRGMLLEEAVLRLLQASGYTTIEDAGNDPTLRNGHSGLEVLGRGCKHQLDAIADPRIYLPFTNPQRLVVEAKCYSPNRPVGLPIVRNAVGVVKDISEYWVPPRTNEEISTRRYHYQYSIFSASGYTDAAERYAFAQDIYLIQYQQSGFFSPVLASIRNLSHQDFGATSDNTIDIELTDLRRYVRRTGEDVANNFYLNDYSRAFNKIEEYIGAVNNIGWTLLGIIAGRFPIHLIPSQNTRETALRDEYFVQITWDQESWYLSDGQDLLFSFDLPIELFNLYADNGVLSLTQALNLKENALREIQAIVFRNQILKIVTFKLDMDWLTTMRNITDEISKRRTR